MDSIPEYSTFARGYDSVGNLIELWKPEKIINNLGVVVFEKVISV
jgi:hypothetical protein